MACPARPDARALRSAASRRSMPCSFRNSVPLFHPSGDDCIKSQGDIRRARPAVRLHRWMSTLSYQPAQFAAFVIAGCDKRGLPAGSARQMGSDTCYVYRTIDNRSDPTAGLPRIRITAAPFVRRLRVARVVGRLRNNTRRLDSRRKRSRVKAAATNCISP